jgi:FtsP/CotA-like multicopper oxidase with cupredoxin domain
MVLESGYDYPTNWNLTLYVREYRHSNTKVSFNTRAYCINATTCSYPGPTIQLNAGDNLTFTLVNELGAESSTAKHVHNTLRSPNTTNVHTHGLHVDPNVDSVFKVAEPGQNITYHYEIHNNHAPGLHWYHAHYHGSSTLQLMGGLAGALIVKPATVDNIPSSITNADSFLLVVTNLIFAQEADNGVVTQGCGDGWVCDAVSQAPLCYGGNYPSFRLF